MSALIKADRVGMRFRLYLERNDTLKETFLRWVRGKGEAHRDLWALQDVSFEINRGESVGIIGRNGSGKSTLLKVVAGVFEPTHGGVSVNGTVSALIELGAGFNGELTGRENVFMNGAIMGLSRREMENRYDAIVDFAELHDFMDAPVKNYSSGMYARLGFAIATSVGGDVLLIDEVLGVGDEEFQKKCARRIGDELAAGKTVLFVSHDAASVQKICTRCLVLHHGRLVYSGPTDAALAEYRRLVDAERSRPTLTLQAGS